MPGSWPKNGLFIVYAKNGKYWAETLDPLLMGDAPVKDRVAPWERHDLFENLIQPVLDSLQEQASGKEKCNGKAKAN